jgi:hypothetical protein
MMDGDNWGLSTSTAAPPPPPPPSSSLDDTVELNGSTTTFLDEFREGLGEFDFNDDDDELGDPELFVDVVDDVENDNDDSFFDSFDSFSSLSFFPSGFLDEPWLLFRVSLFLKPFIIFARLSP